VKRGQQENQGRREYEAKPVLPVKLGLREKKDVQDRLVQVVLQDAKVHREMWVSLEISGLWEILAQQARQEQQECRAILDTQGIRVILALQDTLALRVRRLIQEQLEILGI